MVSSGLDALEAKISAFVANTEKASADHGQRLKELEAKPTEEGWRFFWDSLSALRQTVTIGHGFTTQASTVTGPTMIALAVIPQSWIDWFLWVFERIGKLFNTALEFFAEWFADESTVTKLLKDRDTWITIGNYAQKLPKAITGEDSFRYTKGSAGELVPLEWEGHVADIYYATVRQQALAVQHLASLADAMPAAILAAANGALSIMASLGALIWRIVTPLVRLVGLVFKAGRNLVTALWNLVTGSRGAAGKEVMNSAAGRSVWSRLKKFGSDVNKALKDIVMAFGNLILAIYAYIYGETVLKQQTTLVRGKAALPVSDLTHEWPRARDIWGRLFPTYNTVNGKRVLVVGPRTFDLPTPP